MNESRPESGATERPWCPTSDPASWACYVGLRMTEYGGTKRVVVSSIRDGYVWIQDV